MSIENPPRIRWIFDRVQAHPFTNTGQVPGVGPKGKDWRDCAWDKFNEESCGEHVS